LTSLPLAIGVSSLGFMAHHVCIVSVFFGWFSPTSIGLSLAVAAGGAIWAWLYHRTGSLWGPWISHALVDAGIFVIGYDLVM
jgi:membrane protease YdiL (CAAX protease family)